MILLAIDDYSLQFRRNLCYYMSKPTVRKEPVLQPSKDSPKAPDRQVANFYGTVLYDEGKYRMWYYGMNEVLPIAYQTSMICYAESDDGINWTKPNLGQIECKGSSNNNAIYFPGIQSPGACVIKDEDDPDPQRRYKLVYDPLQEKGPIRDSFGVPVSTLATATSPDGINWKLGSGWPIDVFSELSSFYKHEGMYYVHGQGIFSGGGEGGSEVGRQGYLWVSPDFENWVQGWAEAFTLPEPSDPNKRGYEHSYDQVHLGIGAANFGNVQVGLFGRWRPGKGEPPIHTLKGIEGDLGLVVSSDGMHFREPVKSHIYISAADSLVTPREGKDYPTILCQYNGILNVGDETRIYHGRWRNAGLTEDYHTEIALATLPRDRWGALGLFPKQSEGWVWSAPITLPEKGLEISINADNEDLFELELSDSKFRLIPEFSGENAGVVNSEGGIESRVSWSGDISRIAGSEVRIKINMAARDNLQPKLYAAYVNGQ